MKNAKNAKQNPRSKSSIHSDILPVLHRYIKLKKRDTDRDT